MILNLNVQITRRLGDPVVCETQPGDCLFFHRLDLSNILTTNKNDRRNSGGTLRQKDMKMQLCQIPNLSLQQRSALKWSEHLPGQEMEPGAGLQPGSTFYCQGQVYI